MAQIGAVQKARRALGGVVLSVLVLPAGVRDSWIERLSLSPSVQNYENTPIFNLELLHSARPGVNIGNYKGG